jgi:hypothetical protein
LQQRVYERDDDGQRDGHDYLAAFVRCGVEW